MSISTIPSSAAVTPNFVGAKTQPQATAPSASSPASSAAAGPQAASAAAISAVTAALKEATETSVQTAREAAKGDRQAQKLLARETAARAARNGDSAAATQSSTTKGASINLKA